jgi:hypothetical protein
MSGGLSFADLCVELVAAAAARPAPRSAK